MSDRNPTPDDRLTIEVADSEDAPRLVLTGEVDPHTAPLLEEHIGNVLRDDLDRLVIDMASVTFVDSAGLRVIADTQRSLGSHEGRLVLRSPSAGLRKLLSVTGLDDHIDLES